MRHGHGFCASIVLPGQSLTRNPKPDVHTFEHRFGEAVCGRVAQMHTDEQQLRLEASEDSIASLRRQMAEAEASTIAARETDRAMAEHAAATAAAAASASAAAARDLSQSEATAAKAGFDSLQHAYLRWRLQSVAFTAFCSHPLSAVKSDGSGS